MIYINRTCPLIEVFDNKLELFNTTYCSILFMFSIVYSDFYDTKGVEDTLGIISIALISLFILANILIVFYQAYFDLRLISSKYYKLFRYRYFKNKTEAKLNQVKTEEAIKNPL